MCMNDYYKEKQYVIKYWLVGTTFSLVGCMENLSLMWYFVNWWHMLWSRAIKYPINVPARLNLFSSLNLSYLTLPHEHWNLCRVCAKQWHADLAIAFSVIDPTGFLGNGKTGLPHLPWLVGHSVCLIHILTTDEEDRRAAAWDSGSS